MFYYYQAEIILTNTILVFDQEFKQKTDLVLKGCSII